MQQFIRERGKPNELTRISGQNLPEKGKVPLYYLLQLLAQDVEDTSKDALEFVQALEVIEGDDNVEY